MELPAHWGTTPDERARRTPADALVPAPRARWTRGVTSPASPEDLWLWVCQLTVAPYSYDLIDNRGRRSPRLLTPGADDLRVGQRLLVLFVIDSFDPGEQLTLRLRRRGTGSLAEFAITYAVAPDPRGSRLVATVTVDGARRGGLLRYALAWGDLVMMRRQLRLASLAPASFRPWAKLEERVGRRPEHEHEGDDDRRQVQDPQGDDREVRRRRRRRGTRRARPPAASQVSGSTTSEAVPTTPEQHGERPPHGVAAGGRASTSATTTA